MPQIIIRGVLASQIAIIENDLIRELAALTEIKESSFTLEVFQTERIKNGQITTDYPFVEVKWFDKGQEIQDKAALIINGALKEIGVVESNINFIHLEKENYYYKGKHY